MKESGVILTRFGEEDEKDTIFCPGCWTENIVEDTTISSTYETIDISCFGIFKYIYRWKRLKCDNCQSIFIKYDVEREVCKKVVRTIIFSIISTAFLIITTIYCRNNSQVLLDLESNTEDFWGSILVGSSIVLIICSIVFIAENCTKKLFRRKPEDLLS